MSPAFQRAMVLYGQDRHDLAIEQFTKALAEDPDDFGAHTFLALSLAALGRGDDALRAANEAVRLDPEAPLGHYARARALHVGDRYRDAEAALDEAIRLDPDNADFRGTLAAILSVRQAWPEALAAADAGLALDARNSTCLNFRALALVQLGRKDEAAATLGDALADDPEDSLTHANQGWTSLHRGDHTQALDHFREALRLDPNNEWARAGIVEALKARHLVYRLMLRFFLWMGRQGSRAQWVVILAFVFGRKLLADLAQARPELAPYVTPILALSFGFLMLTWIASPFFNFLLQFNRFGRLALTREEKVEANVIGVCFLAAAAMFAANLAVGGSLTTVGMVFFGFLLPPLAVTFRQPSGRPRLILAACTLGLASLCVPIFAFLWLGPASPFGGAERAIDLFGYFVVGAMLSTWLPSLLGLRDAGR